MTVITDLQYFSNCIFYSELNLFTHCIFDQYVAPPKASFFNRTRVVGANGVIVLSIPLEGGRGQKKMAKDVRIADTEPWQAQHWKTLFSAYNRSPWFGFYAAELEKIYRRNVHFLVDWNMFCHEWVCDKLSLKIKSSLLAKPEASLAENVSDHRLRLLPGKLHEFEAVRYPQVFEDRHGFIPDLSILDWLFCMGGNNMPVFVRSNGR